MVTFGRSFLWLTGLVVPQRAIRESSSWVVSRRPEQLAPTARRQQPMPLLGSNRASNLANGSMDPDRAWLHSFCRSEPYHKVLDVKRERKSSQIFT